MLMRTYLCYGVLALGGMALDPATRAATEYEVLKIVCFDGELQELSGIRASEPWSVQSRRVRTGRLFLRPVELGLTGFGALADRVQFDMPGATRVSTVIRDATIARCGPTGDIVCAVLTAHAEDELFVQRIDASPLGGASATASLCPQMFAEGWLASEAEGPTTTFVRFASLGLVGTTEGGTVYLSASAAGHLPGRDWRTDRSFVLALNVEQEVSDGPLIARVVAEGSSPRVKVDGAGGTWMLVRQTIEGSAHPSPLRLAFREPAGDWRPRVLPQVIDDCSAQFDFAVGAGELIVAARHFPEFPEYGSLRTSDRSRVSIWSLDLETRVWSSIVLPDGLFADEGDHPCSRGLNIVSVADASSPGRTGSVLAFVSVSGGMRGVSLDGLVRVPVE